MRKFIFILILFVAACGRDETASIPECDNKHSQRFLMHNVIRHNLADLTEYLTLKNIYATYTDEEELMRFCIATLVYDMPGREQPLILEVEFATHFLTQTNRNNVVTEITAADLVQ